MSRSVPVRQALTAGALLVSLTACGGHGSTVATPATATVTITATPSPSNVTAPTDPASSGSATESTGDTPSSPPSSSDGSAGTTSADGACALMPRSDLVKITGIHFTRTVPDSLLNGQILTCEYSDNGSDLLQVTVTSTNGSTAYDTDLTVLSSFGSGPKQVSGVGDKAFSMPDPAGNAGAAGAAAFASYGALFGDVYVKIGGLPYVNADQGAQIVNEIHAAR